MCRSLKLNGSRTALNPAGPAGIRLIKNSVHKGLELNGSRSALRVGLSAFDAVDIKPQTLLIPGLRHRPDPNIYPIRDLLSHLSHTVLVRYL